MLQLLRAYCEARQRVLVYAIFLYVLYTDTSFYIIPIRCMVEL